MKAPQALASKIVSASALGLVMGFAMSSSASAVEIACSGGTGDTAYDISDYVSTATDCLIASPLDGAFNDVPQPDFVNGTITTGPNKDNDFAFFGFTNWKFNGKDSGTSLATLFDFDTDRGNLSGDFTAIGPFNGITDIMFVFKDGSGTNLVAYLVGTGSGDWDSPFVTPPFDNYTGGQNPKPQTKAMSHISVYYRGGPELPPEETPEPGVLFLMGAGLLGLGMARRRKSA